ncbi:MAG: CotH kinase family protein [Bacillota bacterium]|nr:CotH kinase family protein [Bacillota bacterium]
MKKKIISVLLVLCMLATLVPAMAFAAEATEIDEAAATEAAASEAETAEPADSGEAAEAAEEADSGEDRSDIKRVFNSDMYVNANAEVGLEGKVTVAFDLVGCSGTLYLPGSADAGQLFFSWDDSGITVSKDGTVYESGTAPVAPAGECVTYKITKDYAFAYVTVKTVKGSADVASMFINLDESKGTIDAMNSDDDHETSCYGSVNFDGTEFPYMSMKGRGNSTWVFDKKPYNLTFYKKDDYDKKQKVELIDGVKAKKWSLLANYLDSSLLRNKIAFDLAKTLGVGLDSRFVDVWMNGEYLGNYLLTPKKDYNTADSGFVLDNDHIDDPDSGVQFKFPNIAEMPLKHNRINVEDIGDDAVAAGVDLDWIEAYFTEAWNTVLDFDSEEYQSYFDIDSWAKMYLMFEVSKTYDCYAGNILMHRDGLTADDKLIAGPAWDYDVSFGRTLHKFFVGVLETNQINAEGWYNDSVGFVASSEPYSILQGLGMHESFMKRVAEIYNDYKWAFEDLADNVDRQREILEASAMMDNERWGTNHLSTDYTVSPSLISALGTGGYKLNYEVTLTWDNYVNNLKEFCTKRVMWLSDHLYAEYPQGSVTQTLLNQDTIALKASLTAGNQENTYQWQSSADGKNWTDMEGETNASLKLAMDKDYGDIQYRCVVKNAGVKIYTTHGGATKASAVTVLEPVTVKGITMAENEVALSEGVRTFVLNGKEMGEFTFAAYGNGWSICNAEGKYVALDGKKLVLSDDPFAWSYDNGVFSAKIKVTYTLIGRLLGLSSTQTVYLSQSGSELAASVQKGAAAEFLVRYPVMA